MRSTCNAGDLFVMLTVTVYLHSGTVYPSQIGFAMVQAMSNDRLTTPDSDTLVANDLQAYGLHGYVPTTYL